MLEVFLRRLLDVSASLDRVQEIIVHLVVLVIRLPDPLAVLPVCVVLVLGPVVCDHPLDGFLLRDRPGDRRVAQLVPVVVVLGLCEVLLHEVDLALLIELVHFLLLVLIGEHLIEIRRLCRIADAVALKQHLLVVFLLDVLDRLHERIGLPLVLAALRDRLICFRLLDGQRLESIFDPVLRLLRRRSAEQHALRQLQRHIARPVCVRRILQLLLALVVEPVFAAVHHGHDALQALSCLSAAHRQRRIRQRLRKLVYQHLRFLLRRHVLFARQQRLVDLFHIRESRDDRNAVALQIKPHPFVQPEHCQQLRVRQLVDHAAREALPYFLRRLLLRRIIPALRVHAVLGHRLPRVRHLVPRHVADRIVQHVQRVQRRPPAKDCFCRLIIEPCADCEFQQRLHQSLNALLPFLRAHVLEDPTQFVVDLQLELREHLHDRAAHRVHERRRALAAVCHDAGRELVGFLQRALLRHAALHVLDHPCPDDGPRRKSIDLLHHPARDLRRLIHA